MIDAQKEHAQNKLRLEIFIEASQEGDYITLPFNMPADTAAMTLRYHYARHDHPETKTKTGLFTGREEINIIDLGLIASDGSQAGASGSDKTEITIGEIRSTPGYKVMPLLHGEWQILVGAYKVAPQGVQVTYELEFIPKTIRLLKGDLHTHTLASDGVLTLEELGRHALRHGLDFLAITDHNQLVSKDALPDIEGLTMIPGVEWSHYQGHANFLGVDQPFDGPYFTDKLEDTREIFENARERGALITLNHPFEESCPYSFDLDALLFDVLEVWNGPMRESNLRAIALWQGLLGSGKKIPICGGSDYHRDRLFQILGGPTMCVYAPSASMTDILSAVRIGHSFITFSPEGPTLQLRSGEAIMGDSLAFEGGQVVSLDFKGLQQSDVLKLITPDDIVDIFTAPMAGEYQCEVPVAAPGFMRVEIWRTFLPGIPPLPALVSNPIYFDRAS
jgi:hypothetical protein